MGGWSGSDKECQILETNYIYNSFCIHEYHYSRSHKFSSKPVIMANGKEASGLVPRAAWESWAPSQLTLGPEQEEAAPSPVLKFCGAGQLSKPGKAMGLQPSTTTGLHPGLLFHIESSCTRTLQPKLYPHAQKLSFGKSSGEKKKSLLLPKISLML